jgi:hypothetical protein
MFQYNEFSRKVHSQHVKMEAEAASIMLWIEHKLTMDKVQVEEIVAEFFWKPFSKLQISIFSRTSFNISAVIIQR